MRISNLTLGSIVQLVSILALIVGILAYVQFQARNIILGPTISLSNDPSVVQHERTVTLEGMARNIVKLTLNGKEIHTNERGEFSHLLVLENGYTIMTLRAEDRFGRTTSLTERYVYVPQS